jgi:tetratricopeptide (TPR) repeat protein
MIREYITYLCYVWGSSHRHFANQIAYKPSYKHAIKWYSRTLNRNPDYREARLDRAILQWRELSNYEAAIADFDVLLNGDPFDAPARLNRGLVHERMGDYQKALRDLEAYVRLPVTEPEYWHYTQRLMKVLQGVVEEQKEGGVEAGE